MRVLWNEIIGFIFLCFAILGGFSAVRQIRSYTADADSIFRITLTLLFTAIMLWFGVGSFLRARRISRS